MKLHRLEVTAFGPFAGTVEVDFDAVGVGGLFLVHGPTGAGKTSLLDAVCFALYGGVPGSRPGGRALRSDHAGPGAVPCVRLEFGVSQRRFRVTRSPEFRRPKRRGHGETTSPAQVVLEEHVAGRWTGRSARADEVGDIVAEVLGMGLDQFSKVVLLPQGEFAAFLRATADERRTLLEKLFDISTYSGVESWLVERRRTLSARVAEERARLVTDLARLGDVLAAVPSDTAEAAGAYALDSVPVEALPALLTATQGRLDQLASGSLAAAERADVEARAATERHLRLAANADLQRRGRRAREVLLVLSGEGTTLASCEVRIAAAVRADAVSGDLRALVRVRQLRGSALDRLEAARSAMTALGVTDWSPTTVAGLVQTMQEQAALLDDAAAADRRATADQRRLDALDQDAQKGLTALRETRTSLDQVARTIAAATSDIKALDHTRRACDGARSRLQRLQGVHAISVELDEATVLVREVGDAARRSRDLEQDARQEHLERQQARLDGMAAELAGSLRDGIPCAVCGSAEHPAPARSRRPVTADALARSERTWRTLAETTLRTAQSLAAAEQVVTTRTADLAAAFDASLLDRLEPTEQTEQGEQQGEQAEQTEHAQQTGQTEQAGQTEQTMEDGSPATSIPSTAELVTVLGRARRDLAAWMTRLARLDGAPRELESARERQQILSREVEALAASAAASRGTVTEVTARAVAERTNVAALVGRHATGCPCQGARAVAVAPTVTTATEAAKAAACIPDLVAAHADALARLRALHAALVTTQDLDYQVRAVEQETARAVSDAGFDSLHAAAAAVLDPVELGELRRQVRDADDRRAAAEATMADPEVSAALDAPAADPAAAVVEVDSARGVLRQAQHLQTTVESAVRAFERLSQALTERVGTLVPLAREAAQVTELADAVTGVGEQNVLRMRLTAFVLAARLERVAALANERLLVMGDGRYQLAHTDDLARGGRRSGLGLVVHDQWTGQERDTASLSGGESFMASLALALGLADAVREEAGGFDLNTLFIDEGFGTLDEESLEQVMAVLDGLRDGGRCVGVVSHVSDLRSRVPAQVRVDKTATGSTVTILGLDDFAA